MKLLRLALLPVWVVTGQSAETPTKFAKPEMKGVALDACCVKLLKAHSAKLEAAGSAKKLMAWTPLIVLAGETSAPHMAFSIATLNWEELANGIGMVNKLAFTTLATDCLVHSQSDHNSRSAKAFWKAMSDFYLSQAAGSPAEPVYDIAGPWKGSMKMGARNSTFSVLFQKSGERTTGQLMISPENQGPCDNLQIKNDGTITFSVGDNTHKMNFTGKIASGAKAMTGTFTSPHGNGSWTAKKS